MGKYLVTGDRGFIGTNLVARLEQEGHEVEGWDIKAGKDVLNLRYGIKGFDKIYYLACCNQMEAVNNHSKNLHVNSLGVKYAAKAACKVDIPLVYTSTASVYGNAPHFPTDEYSPPDPESDYAVAKLAGEGFVKNSGCEYTILRLSNVYGPGQTTDNPYCGVVAKFIEKALRGEPLQIIGDGMQTRDFTYVEDVVDILMDDSLKGTWNVSHGDEISVNALATAVFDCYGRNTGIDRIPDRPIDGIRRRWLDSDLSCPTDLADGLGMTLDWVRANEQKKAASKAYS